ncbi:MAG: hypothetical protein HRU30_13260 [Rhodobacteraceae bacterium]|nr:hypothetical protein [Paracoccaceae bacterium]
MRWIAALAVMAAPAFAETCPDPIDISAEMVGLLDGIQAAPSASAARPWTEKMWRVWLRAPDTVAQNVLDRGMSRQRNFDLLGAQRDFDTLVSYCPTYAEGYNQRAFTNYLGGKYDAALADLDKAIVLSPTHVGALAGRALTLMQMGRFQEARAQMLDAVALNPWLSERALLEPGQPLEAKEQDL